MRAATATEDTKRLQTSIDNVSAVDGTPDSQIRNAVANEDTNRLPSAKDDPQSRVPVDSTPDSKINNATANEDAKRLQTSIDNVSPGDGTPESRVTDVAANEDSNRLKPSVDNVSAADGTPETQMKAATDNEDSNRLKPSIDNVSPGEGTPETRAIAAAANEDNTRSPRFGDEKIDSVSQTKIKEVVDRMDIKGEGTRTRLKNMFKRLGSAATVSSEIVEGRVFDPDGRVRPLSENPGGMKYDSKAAGAFGTGPTPECRQTPKGREIIARELSEVEVKSRRTPRGAMIKSAALKAGVIAFEAVGAIGDVMDVLQIIQVLGNAAYYDPGCEQNPQDPALCKFPTEFLTANQAKDISKLVVKKQIDTLALYTPKDLDFKPQFPLIRGPLDVLSDDPYQNQTLIQLEVDAVQNRILNGDPWRSKFLTYFGNQTTIDEIVNDPRDGLSYYTSKVGMTNQEIDSVYETAFTAVCLQNKGKVWKDTYTSGRPRFQCGFTAAGCDTARRQYFSPSGKGNYVEWYTYTDINTLLASMTPPLTSLNFTSKPSDEDGFCMVSSPGTASLCNYYKGNYDGSTHKCEFSAAYCQSIGACHNSIDKVCYLPGPEMEALNFFFAGGGVREWIKVNGCTFVGTATDAQKAQFAAMSVMYTFMPITMLFTANGRKMFQDVIANSRNWGPGIKAQLNDPMIGVSVAGAIVGLTAMTAVAAGFAGSGIGLPVAALIMVAVGITMAITMQEAQAEENATAKVDKEDLYFQGIQKVVVDAATAQANPGTTAGTYYMGASRGYADGWVTRKLPVTKKADGTLCTAVENYRNPTTCYEVASTADNPHVFKIPFTSTRLTTVSTTNQGGSSSTQSYNYEYNHKIQCWKYDYTSDNLGTKTTDAAFGTIPAGKQYGEPYGTIDATMHNKVFNGYIRAGTEGYSNKAWCMRRRPDTVMFDATIGTPAAETEYSANRSWTSKMGDAGLYYPEYPTEAAVLSAELHNHFRYQLVYDKDSIPEATMWDNLLMEAVFTEATIAEIRRYYCEQELIKYSSDTTRINKKCFGYLSMGLPGYTWFAMSIPGRVSSTFNTTTGTVTTGIPTQDNRDNKCAMKYGTNYEEDSKGLCYLNCNYGTGATSDTYAYVSNQWKSDSAAMCYKQYPKWEDNGRGHGEQTITKKIVTADWQGTPNSCGAGKERGSGVGIGFCYPTCSSLTPNLDTTKYRYETDGASLCYKHNKEWEDEATRKGRPAGTGYGTYTTMNKPLAFGAVWRGLKSNGVCPSGYENVVGTCYTNCNSDQTGVGPTCFNKYCPSGTTERTAGLCTNNCNSEYSWDESACYKDCRTNFFRSSLGFCQENCHDMTYSGLSAPTRQVTAGICSAYNFSCPSSYDAWGVGTSTPTCYRPFASRARTLSCPKGYNRNGVLCEKQTYDIGAGTAKQCDITGAGVCHATRPWTCKGGVREEVDSLCYNPCQPAFNGGIICPADATNNNGYCEKPVPVWVWTPPPPPSWWYAGIRCPQSCGGGYQYCYEQNANCRTVENCGYEDVYVWWSESYESQYVCSSYETCDYVNVCYDVPYTCSDVNPVTDINNYSTLADWCASTPDEPATDTGGGETGGWVYDSWYTGM
jgi:hypothetical protein